MVPTFASKFARQLTCAAILTLTLVAASTSALAQYKLTKLTANQPGKAKHTDPLLVNGWGLAYGPGNPFWVSDAGNGWSTLYDGMGVPQSLQVIVPTANGTGFGSPTGIAFNAAPEFKIRNWASLFLFCTLDGSIQGWSTFNLSASLVGVNNSAKHAIYTGLGVTTKPSGNFLYVANFNSGKVEMYDSTFKLLKSFTDPKVPKTFAPFNVQDIGGKLYVTFAEKTGKTGGYVVVFSEAGVLLKRLTSGGPLNQPWGLAMAPANFGPLSKTLLVANNIDKASTISGFNPTTGALVGTMMDTTGKPIGIDQLWGIEFGGGTPANGKTNQLFFAAGPNANLNGLFGVIQ